jgi:bifunctional non-homologous end joining protein LigD
LPGVTASAIRLITRNGFDWAARYTLVVNAVAALKVSSCLIDGKITVCDHSGVAVFGHVLQRRHRDSVPDEAEEIVSRSAADPIETPWIVIRLRIAEQWF